MRCGAARRRSDRSDGRRWCGDARRPGVCRRRTRPAAATRSIAFLRSTTTACSITRARTPAFARSSTALARAASSPFSPINRWRDAADSRRPCPRAVFPAEAVFGGDGPFPRKPDPAGLLSSCGAGVGVRSVSTVARRRLRHRLADRTAARVARSAWLAMGLVSRAFPFTSIDRRRGPLISHHSSSCGCNDSCTLPAAILSGFAAATCSLQTKFVNNSLALPLLR